MDTYSDLKKPVKIAEFEALPDKKPQHAKVVNTDLVVIRYGEDISVLYGRCLHI